MTITELIELLKDHLKKFGDIKVINFIGTVVTNEGLEIQSESKAYKELKENNLEPLLLETKDKILEFYDNN